MRLLLGLVLLAAALVLWAGTALGQSTLTFSATHTGSATVTNGRVQLLEGGAATTFQIALPADFLTTLKAVHPEATRPGARFGAFLYIIRDSSDVTWDTSDRLTPKDRTAEYTISYNGTEIQPRYSAASSTLPERMWLYIPLTGSPPGSASSYAAVDSFDAASFPITFTIQVESDSTHFEDESIRVRGRFILSGSQATPSFTSIRYNSNDLTFDLVDGPLPAPTAAPTQPANLTATVGKGAVALAWDAVDATSSNTNRLNDVQITKHQVRQSTDGGANYGTWTDIPNSAHGEVNATSYTIGSLTDGTEYAFEVRAVNSFGNSDSATATTKPTQPANLTAVAGKGAVTLTWDAVDESLANTNVANDVQITKHRYRQSTDGGANYGTWTDIPNSAHGGVNANSYTIGSLTDGTEYTFQVRAVNSFGNSDPATAIMATPDADAPPRPTGLTATPGNTQVTLTWDDPRAASPNAFYYEYQQKEGRAPFGPWREIPDSNAATTTFRLTGLQNGTAYSYRIRVRTGLRSISSGVVTVTPQGAPPAAPVLTAIPRNGGVTLSWPNPFDVSLAYEYQYKIGAGAYGPWRVARERTAEDCGSSSSRPFCRRPYVDASGATLKFPVDGLANGTGHTFRIRAVNDSGKTVSNEASATPVAGVPSKPTGLTTRLVYRQTTAIVPDVYQRLDWDRVVDSSILRYEYSTDDGRTWSHLVSGRSASSHTFPEDEFLSGYTFRIRAVNTLGPGPASDPAVETDVTRTNVYRAWVEWDSNTMKATLVWDQTRNTNLRWWSLWFSAGSERNAEIPIGTTRYEIPGTFSAGDTITVIISGCAIRGCVTDRRERGARGVSIPVGAPSTVITGFTVTEGDGSIILAWDAPTDTSITHFQYQTSREGYGRGGGSTGDVSDGDDPGSDRDDETSYTVTSLTSDDRWSVRLRAANAHGGGPWTHWSRFLWPSSAGVPAQPIGFMLLRSGNRILAWWDDPQDPSITHYQRYDGAAWFNIPRSDATTTSAHWILGGGAHLRAVNANGVGPSAYRTLLPLPAPQQPTGLKAAPGHRRVTLTWDDPGRGVLIDLYRYTADGGETWTEIPDSGTTGQGHLTRYTVPGLTNGQTYTFAVQAENALGASPVSAAVTATPQDGPPAAFTGLVAEPGDSEVTLTWNDPRDPSITRYTITRQDVTSWSTITPVPGSRAGTTSHTVTGLTNGVSYQIRIAAVNELGSLRGSATGFVTVTPGVPAAPASLSVVAGDAQAALTWTAPARNNGSPVTGYEYTSNANTATPTWADVPDSGSDGRADERQYTVTGLVNNRTYTFAVRAENANGRGVATPARRAVPVDPQAPRGPAALKAHPGHQEVRLTWASPLIRNSVTAYQYRQSTDRGKTWSPDWTAIAGSNAGTTEHRLTGLANGTAYTFELRALKGAIAGPSARVRATPGQASARQGHMIDSRSSGSLTAPSGDTYRVTQLSPPEGLDWQIVVPGTTDINGRTLTVRSLQGTTPYTSPRHAFTSSGQEGLDIVVHPPISGAAQVCLEPSDLLRFEAESRPLLVLRYSGTSWTELPTSADGDMLCGTTAGFSAFVLGYASASSTTTTTTTTTTGSGGGGGTPSAPANAPPTATQPLPPQVAVPGVTGEPLDLTPYFRDADGDPLRYVAVSDDVGVVIADLARGSSELTLYGVGAGQAVVTVTASDPQGESVSQFLTVTVGTQAGTEPEAAPASALPEVARRILPQIVVAGEASEPLDLTPYFRDPDGAPLTFAVVSYDPDVLAAEVAAGSSELVLRGIEAGDAVFIVTATDPSGGSVIQPVAVTVRTNTALEASRFIPPQVVEVGAASEPLDLAPYFDDPEGDALTYVAASDDTDVVVAEVSEGSSRLVLRGVAPGEADVVVMAGDLSGERARQTVAVTVRTNAAPEVVQAIAPQVVEVGAAGEPLDLTEYFRDADGDPLIYAAISQDAGVVAAGVSAGGSELVLRGVAAGATRIVVGARDSLGKWARQMVRVTVRAAALVATQPMPPRTVVAGAAAEPLDVAAYFSDPEGGPLAYAAESDDVGVVIADLSRGGSRLALTGVSAGRAVVVVTASDASGGQASRSMGVTVRTNAAPEAVEAIPAQSVLAGVSNAPLDLAGYFRDADGDPLTFSAESDNPGVVASEVVAGGSELVLTGVAAGEAAVLVTASDPHGGVVSQPVTVRTNGAPMVVRPLPPQVVAPGVANAPLDLSAYFVDPDGDPLTFRAVSDNLGAVVSEVVEGSRLMLTGVSAGEAVIVVTARDPHGGTVSQLMTAVANSVPVAVQPIPPQVVPTGGPSDPLDLAGYFRDPDGDPLTFSAESDNPGVVTAEVVEGSRLVLTGVSAGAAVVLVTASDPRGGSISQPLQVRTNTAPVVVQPLPPQVVPTGGTSEPLDLAGYFRDPDGDALTYAAESDNPGAVAAEVVEGSSQLVLTGVAAGEAAIVVTASDPYGGTVSQSMDARANSAPVVARPIPPQAVALGVTSEPLDLAEYFRDPDGDPLTYAAESDNPEVMTAALAGALFTVTGVGVGSATATVTARDPHGAEASQSVSVTVRVAEPAWVKAWTARFGRTVTGQVLDGVQDRLRRARQTGFEATLAGHRIGDVTLDEEVERGEAALRRELGTLAGWMDGQTEDPESSFGARQALSGRDLLTSTAFTLTGGGPENGFGALWGRGVVSHFSGEDGALSLDGEVATGMLGADWVSGRWLAGLTLAMSRGTGGYRVGESSGDIESTLTGLYPWVGYHLTERLSVWTAAGYGAGVLTLTAPEQEATSTDLSLTLVAAGARSELFELPRLGGIVLALETDTRLTRTATGATTALDATDATVWQVRLGLEGSRHVALEGGGALRPSVEVGLRHDGGDAETGSGIELGAGLGFSRPASGLSLDLAVRGLLTHEASGLEEWGASASLMYDPTPASGQGLSMSLQQSVGASSSGGLNALLARETMAAPVAYGDIHGASRLQAQMGYGLPLGGGRFIGTPQLGFGLSEGRHDYTLGWHLSVARREELGLTLGVEAKRLENADGSNPEHGVMLQLRLGH